MDLAFGKAGLRLDLPPGLNYRVLEARSAKPVPDAAAALESALDEPIGSTGDAAGGAGDRAGAG